MKTSLLSRPDGGVRVEIDFDQNEKDGVDNILDFLFDLASMGSIEIAREWACLFTAFHGRKFIAGNVCQWWMDDLAKEGLILMAETEEEYEKLVAGMEGGAA